MSNFFSPLSPPPPLATRLCTVYMYMYEYTYIKLQKLTETHVHTVSSLVSAPGALSSRVGKSGRGRLETLLLAPPPLAQNFGMTKIVYMLIFYASE